MVRGNGGFSEVIFSLMLYVIFTVPRRAGVSIAPGLHPGMRTLITFLVSIRVLIHREKKN